MSTNKQKPDTTHGAYTPNHANAALNWFNSMCSKGKWNLTLNEQTKLLGEIESQTFQNWKTQAQTGKRLELHRNTLERLSLLLGIHNALNLIAPNGDKSIAYQWFNTPNEHPMFNGLSPKDFIIATGTIEALHAVRRYLEARH